MVTVNVPMGKKGKHIGCGGNCEEEYRTYSCLDCPDPQAPSEQAIIAYEQTLTSIFGVRHNRPRCFYCKECGKRHHRKSHIGRKHLELKQEAGVRPI